jgi:hypothetical protein
VHATILLAASAAIVPPPSPDAAVDRQRQAVREAIEWNPCRDHATPEEIVVCGRLAEPEPTTPVSRYDPGLEWRPPERGPWFELRRGPLTISCCAISTGRGTGSGVGLRLTF